MAKIIGEEEWKNVTGYFGKYAISDWGRVKSFHGTGRILKLKTDKDGYLRVSLSKDNSSMQYGVHQLVAKHFLVKGYGDTQVHHKDEVKANNFKSNLEWCDSQYNNEQRAARWYLVLPPDKDYIQIFNLKKFCRDNGLDQGAMWRVLNNKQKTHKGWRIWEL